MSDQDKRHRESQQEIRRFGGKPGEMIAMGISLGVAAGAGFGIAIGLALGNLMLGLPAGMGMGIALGVAFGATLEQRRGTMETAQNTPTDEMKRMDVLRQS